MPRVAFPLLVATLSLLAACGGLASNTLEIDNDGGGRFSGHAGPDWTDEEIVRQVGVTVCGGAAPNPFGYRLLDGFRIFNGTCGTAPLAAPIAPAATPTPAAVPAAAQPLAPGALVAYGAPAAPLGLPYQR